jgi:hypothetical protein
MDEPLQRPSFRTHVNHCVAVGTNYGKVFKSRSDWTYGLGERAKVMHVRIASADVAVSLLKIEAAARHLAPEPAIRGHCQCFCELCSPKRTLSGAMSHKPGSHLPLDRAARYFVRRTKLKVHRREVTPPSLFQLLGRRVRNTNARRRCRPIHLSKRAIQKLAHVEGYFMRWVQQCIEGNAYEICSVPCLGAL